MDGLKIPVALVFAMAVQLVALVWYISGLVHDIEHLQNLVAEQKEQMELLNMDVNDLWAFCTFTENKWAEAYTSDMVYERLCGTKEVIKE
jgi:cell division protein FtsB